MGARHVVMITWLTAVWVMLWGELTWANVVGGLAVAIAVVALVPLSPSERPSRFRPLKALALVGYEDEDD